MALPLQTTYEKLRKGFTPGMVKGVGKRLAEITPQARPQVSGRGVDVSQFSRLRNQVSGGQLSGRFGTVSVPFGGSTRFEGFHPGLDIANKIGTRIPSFSPGIVRDVITGKRQGDPGYGNYVIVEDAQGNRHRYSHLNNSYVQVGQQVGRGSVIGEMGNTGQTYSVSGRGTGSHLDYRVKDLFGKYINPQRFVK